MSVSLTRSEDIIAKSVSVINKNKLINLKELSLTKVDAINNIVGLPVATLDSVRKLAEAINSDANLFNNMLKALHLNSDLTYVDTQLDNIIKQFLTYDTIETSTIKLNLKSTITYVDTACQVINNKFQCYGTILGTDMKLADVNTQLDNMIKTNKL